MPYIGNEVGNRFVASKAASVYSGNGSTTAFTLEHAVGSDEDILVSVDGVIQEPSVAYAVSSGTTLTFTAAPSTNSGNNIFVYYLFRTVATVDHPSTSALSATSGTFSTDLTVSGAFTSQGIDDNADATAITIDSSENVLVKKTATNYQTVGVEAKSTGQLWATADGNNPILAVRNSSDGKIQAFYKDTTEVGSIQSRAGAMLSIAFNPSGSDGAGFTGGSNAVLPANASALSDNAIDLGVGSYRYKDLYLSGNIYIGGTGSANAFDDYEEGTWTPAFSGVGSPSYGHQYGRYTKVGRIVHLFLTIHATSVTGSGTAIITGLPFTATETSDSEQRQTIRVANSGHLSGLSTSTARFRIDGNRLVGVKDDDATNYLSASNLTSSGTIQFSGQITFFVA